MQRITWSGIALHGGPLPGYAASHGCVRMPYDFAERLFNKTRIGMRVIIRLAWRQRPRRGDNEGKGTAQVSLESIYNDSDPLYHTTGQAKSSGLAKRVATDIATLRRLPKDRR